MLNKTIIAALGLALGAWLLYVVGINIYLRSGGLQETIASGQDDVVVSYESAWSWWPGLVTADGLRILGQDTAVEWVLDIERTDADIALVSLLTREFRVNTASTSGITFHARFTRPLQALCKAQHIPNIKGLAKSNIDNCTEQQETARTSAYSGGDDDDNDSWTVNLVDVGAYQVHDVWVEDLRWRGLAEVQGTWHFWSMVDMAFDDIDVTIRTGTVSWRGLRGRKLALEGNVSSSSISVDGQKAAVVLARLDLEAEGTMRVDADVESSLGHATVRDAETTFALSLSQGGSGQADATVDVRRGRAQGLGLRVTADVYAKARLRGTLSHASFAGSSATIRNTGFESSNGSSISKGWQADVSTKQATVIPNDARLSGVADFKASDARFAGAIIRQQSNVPGWIVAQLAESPLKGTVDIGRTDDWWFFRRAQLSTGGIDILGHGHLGTKPEARALFSIGGLAAGLHVAPNTSQVILQDATSNYHKHKPAQ